MPVANGDKLKLTAEFTVSRNNTRVQNVYHFEVSDLVDGDEANVHLDLCARVRSAMVAVEDFFNTGFVLAKFRSINLSQTIFLGDSVPVAWAGADISDDNAASQVAVQVIARSLKLGHLGRKYLGPTAELTWQDGALTGPANTAFLAFLAIYEGAFLGGTTTNEYQAGTWNPEAFPTFTAFVPNRGSVTQIARTMRSRIPGRGLS